MQSQHGQYVLITEILFRLFNTRSCTVYGLECTNSSVGQHCRCTERCVCLETRERKLLNLTILIRISNFFSSFFSWRGAWSPGPGRCLCVGILMFRLFGVQSSSRTVCTIYTAYMHTLHAVIPTTKLIPRNPLIAACPVGNVQLDRQPAALGRRQLVRECQMIWLNSFAPLNTETVGVDAHAVKATV